MKEQLGTNYMGKGGYNGGGTIIHPRMAGWFSRGAAADEQISADTPAAGKAKLDKMQVEALDRWIDQEIGTRTAPATIPDRRQRPSLTASAQNRIDKLRIAIKSGATEIEKLQHQLASDRSELEALFIEYGLPLDQLPAKARS